MLGRIVRSADFERALRTPVCARSAHFAVHFVPGRPSAAPRRGTPTQAALAPSEPKLSTAGAPNMSVRVDDFAESVSEAAEQASAQLWFGVVVPKRHARRSVTRSMIKRQIRAAMLRRTANAQAPLRSGLWVVRLRAPFDKAAFPSAASDALRIAARGELDAVLVQAALRLDAAPRRAA